MGRRYEEIMRELVDAIVSGEYAPGEQLPTLNDLRARFGASRDVLREALRGLEERALITVQPANGQRVRDREYWDLHAPDVLRACIALGGAPNVLADTIEARTAVELEAAELATARASDADLLLLKRFVERMAEVSTGAQRSAGADEEFVSADAWFHRTLAQLSDNLVLAKLSEPLHLLLAELRRARAPERDRTVVTHHRRILEGLSSREPDLAQAAVGHYGSQLARWLAARR